MNDYLNRWEDEREAQREELLKISRMNSQPLSKRERIKRILTRYGINPKESLLTELENV